MFESDVSGVAGPKYCSFRSFAWSIAGRYLFRALHNANNKKCGTVTEFCEQYATAELYVCARFSLWG